MFFSNIYKQLTAHFPILYTCLELDTGFCIFYLWDISSLQVENIFVHVYVELFSVKLISALYYDNGQEQRFKTSVELTKSYIYSYYEMRQLL